MSIEQFVKAVIKVVPEHLRLACIGQAIAESGIDDTKLAQEHNNFWGMKWRTDEDFKKCMEGVKCEGFIYYTQSEPTGSAEFIHFPSAVDGVKGWLGFLNRSPYKNKDVSSSEALINSIGPIWCPPGQGDKYKNEHGGRNYQQQIIQVHFKTAKEYLEKYKDSGIDASEVTWHNAFILIDEKTRQMELGLASYAGDKLASLGRFSVDSKLLSSYLSKFPNAINIVKAEPKKEWPSDVIVDPVGNGKKVLLDPGHSTSVVGARSNNKQVKEEVMNKLQAQIIKEQLEAAGFVADIYDPDPDNLTGVGNRAKGYDAFISLHHNSYDGSGNVDGGPYCCVMCLPGDRAKKASVALAGKISAAISEAIGVPNFGGTHGEKGVYRAGLSVLNAAEPVCVGPCVLVESYFLNGITSVDSAVEKSSKAAKAIAKVLVSNV